MNKEYWNSVKIADIKSVNGVGGSFGEAIHTYFSVTMKDGKMHYFHKQLDAMGIVYQTESA
jgi:hypothetical protein